MRDFVIKLLGVALAILLATSSATGNGSQIASSPISRPLGDADLVCSATILGTWQTADSLNVSSSGASERIGRAEVDEVFKGKLIRTNITFRDDRWMLPDDLNSQLGVDVNSIALTLDLRPGTRYMLFLSSDSGKGHRQAVSTYKLDFSVPLAPSGDTPLRLDASKINSAEQKREMVEEFVRAASFILDSRSNVADAYDYFSYIYELLGTDTMPFIQKLLDSADTRLRYFAADKLAEMNEESAVDPLLLVLNDPNLDPWMRVCAAWDLGMLRATKALPDFERLATGDPDADVRWAALYGLDELGDCNSTEVLTRALEDSADSNRLLAASILKKVDSGKTCAVD
jgi:HEAT repeat protein